jgi:hypothetical protein
VNHIAQENKKSIYRIAGIFIAEHKLNKKVYKMLYLLITIAQNKNEIVFKDFFLRNRLMKVCCRRKRAKVVHNTERLKVVT